MTTLNAAKEAVYLRFNTLYTGVAANRIAFDNEEFEEPATGEWVRLTVRSLPGQQSTLGKIGNRRFRRLAAVFVQVYTDANTGVKQSDTLAKEAADVFEGVSFSGLDFGVASVLETGPSGRWYQSVVEAQFEYDEIK